ncbi:hypothetical protein [Pseudidiomarina tainanensis]|uniref:hypothetical protein n=1 Tax=Pseudidiomarina tainanensis TaxID=502365 RepID=UPI0010289CB0|nr:hypothetical protein [Pseudidiomarina tainanensis]
MIAIGWLSYASKLRALDDPNDDSVLALDELVGKSKLESGGEYLVRIHRQSGNLQKDDQLFSSPEAAIKAAVSTFRRAKIEFAVMEENSSAEMRFRRPHYHHGGAAEGKKVGRARIFKIG